MKKEMSRVNRAFKWLVTASAALMTSLSGAAGLLTPVGGNDSLQIISQQVDVKIADGFAVTSVEQVFSNPAKVVLDAQYRFPVPENAAVGQFTYWIHGQAIHGEVVEKKRAQQIFQAEKQSGRKVAVTQQQGYQHFDIKVANLQPGEDAKIKLVYLQVIEVDHGIGRYVYPLEDGGTDDAQNNFWTQKSSVEQAFDFNVELNSGFSVDAVRMPNHPNAQIRQVSSQQWRANLSSQEQLIKQISIESAANNDQNMQSQEAAKNVKKSAFKLDKDIVFYWRLEEGTPGVLDVVAYKNAKNTTGTVMMTLTPNDDLGLIQAGTDWSLVLDISGSMSGKFHTLVEGVKRGLAKFNPQDRVRIILFNQGVVNLSGGFLQASQENLTLLANKLDKVSPDGGTNLMAGMRASLDDLDTDRTAAIWLVTDGVANVGETNQRAFLKMLDKTDIRLFTFIMGNGANRPLLKAMSVASNGFAISVSNSDDILGQLEKAASKVSHESLRDVKVEFNGIEVTDIQPTNIGSLYRGQQLQLFAHYWQAGVGELVVTAKRNGEKVEYRIPVRLPEVDHDFPEIERLWAYSQIQAVMNEQMAFGESDDRKDAVVDLAKQYGLVTPYTSMLVLEESQFKQYSIERTNKQRIEKEQLALKTRNTKGIQDHNQAANHPVLSQPRSNLSGGSGAIDGRWALLLMLVLISRRRLKRLMS
ncbi:MAG: VIT and VWA domain-containing protein [Bermanella sp.]